MKAVIVINCKTYTQTTGPKAVSFAKQIAKVKRKSYDIALAPSLVNVGAIATAVPSLKLIAQHVDLEESGAHTGSISIKELKEWGVRGSLLNHSEKELSFPILRNTLEACQRKRFPVIVCVSNLRQLKAVAKLRPKYIAYEPKELIGSNVSVTSANPKVIVKAVELLKQISPKTKLLCGAGIHCQEDVGQALLLGCKGVLLSHAIVKAKNPKKFLETLLLE